MRGSLRSRLERLEHASTMRESPLIVVVTSYLGAHDGGLGLLTGVEIEGERIKYDSEFESEVEFLARIRTQERQGNRGFVVVHEQRVLRE